MKKLFLAALVSVTLAGCFGNNFSWTNARQIRQGMSEREVIALMGKPTRIQPSPIGLVYITDIQPRYSEWPVDGL